VTENKNGGATGGDGSGGDASDGDERAKEGMYVAIILNFLHLLSLNLSKYTYNKL